MPRGGAHKEETIAGISRALKAGIVVQNIPFGWRAERGIPVPDDDERTLVRALYESALTGLSLRKLAKRHGLIYEEGALAGEPQAELVHRILCSDVYWTGVIRHNGTPTYKLPPIVKRPPWAKGTYAEDKRGARGRFLRAKWLHAVRRR